GLGLALLLTACGSDDGGSPTPRRVRRACGPPRGPKIDLSQYPALPAPSAPAAPTVDCTYPAAGTAAKEVQPPNGTAVSTAGTVGVDLTTGQGPIGMTLDRGEAPCSVNSIVSLTEQAYFDNTPCHRISTAPAWACSSAVTPAVAAAADPATGTTTSTRRTSFAPNDPALNNPVVYPRGTVALANAGVDTNGSQFFLVFEDSLLQPKYTVVGTISEEGLATLDKIAAAGVEGSTSPGDGTPTDTVTIETAKVA
ncbi:peptidylprolyl isomerase, partial [Rhodococcus hoagii]|nr:peptidylprolyl isomerase [Prescottella equi]